MTSAATGNPAEFKSQFTRSTFSVSDLFFSLFLNFFFNLFKFPKQMRLKFCSRAQSPVSIIGQECYGGFYFLVNGS